MAKSGGAPDLVRTLPWLFPAFLCLTVALATPREEVPPIEDFDKRMREAISLHDSGQYDAAVAIYRDLLKKDPKNPQVLYELAYSSLSAGKPKEAIEYAGQALRQHSRYDNMCYAILGNSYDELGELEKGEKAFRRGLKEFPQDASLRFNLGVNQAKQNRMDEAIAEFQQSLRGNPMSASSWRALGLSCRSDGQNARAFMAFARFLTLEPESNRSSAIATELGAILFAHVKATKDDAQKTRIDVTVPEKQDPGPGAAQNLAMALVAATRYTEEWEDKSDVQFFAHAFESVLAILTEVDENATPKDPFWSSIAVPYFRNARQAGHMEAMAYVIRRSLGDAEILGWINDHSEAVDRFGQWSKEWKISAE